jgi:acetylglutamate kinase
MLQKQKLFIIKIGGNVVDNEVALHAFLKIFSAISDACILIHGGGKIATSIGNKLNIESKYIDGRRITDDDTIDLVTMVYGGLVNKKIVTVLQALNCNAIGLTGADANVIPAVKRPVKTIDYGWVGDITADHINTDKLGLFLANGLVPVFAPLTHDGQGHVLNTNADTIASSLAVALSAIYDVRLIYCFERKGVLENVDDDASVIRLINNEKYAQLKTENKLFAGILPKLDNAFAAIAAGVNEVLIGDANDLVRNTTGDTIGTLITK